MSKDISLIPNKLIVAKLVKNIFCYGQNNKVSICPSELFKLFSILTQQGKNRETPFRLEKIFIYNILTTV